MEQLIEVTELALRDAHQSLLATRMATEDMVAILPELDQAGYWSVECWGGATYDACIRFLNEDPWERLRALRKGLPNTRLQMLLRGQNLLGYRHYEEQVVERFVESAAVNGMDVFRVFDALNDLRNLERPIAAVKRVGKHAQGTICYTTSPLHNVQVFIEQAQRLVEMGCDSICLKDMAALLRPQPAWEIVSGIKARCGKAVRVHVHAHSTTGVTMVSLMKAIEAGADVVDTAISSLSLGPGHNPTESLVAMLEGTGYCTRLKAECLRRIRDHFAGVRPRYKAFESNIAGVDTDIFESQIPGGMISNMESQLKQQGASARMREVLEEVPRVRQDAGYPPLVTPTSQIVGTQAVLNVLMGRYQVLTGEFADLMLGYYGETAGPRDQDIVQQAETRAGKPPIECRPADLLSPEWGRLHEETLALPGSNHSQEDVLTYAMFPQVAPGFFQRRHEGPKNVGQDPTQAPAPSTQPLREPVNYAVTFAGKTHRVSISPA